MFINTLYNKKKKMASILKVVLEGCLKSLCTCIDCIVLKVLNHASRTLLRLPYTDLKKSRTENSWLLSMPSRDSLQEK